MCRGSRAQHVLFNARIARLGVCTLCPLTTMSTLFGHIWEGDSCILRTHNSDTPSPLSQEAVATFRGHAQDLSLDILLRIFHWAHLADIDALDFSDRNNRLASSTVPSICSRRFLPRIASQVCHAWRSAALGSANLWSTVIVHDESRYFRRVEAVRENLLKVLGRSRRAPLTVAIKLYSRRKDNLPLKLLITKLFNEKMRWRTVSILSLKEPFPFRGHFLLNNLFNLEDLALMFPAGYGHSVIDLDFSNCRRLRKLRLDGDFHFASDGTPLDLLEHVELSSSPRHDSGRSLQRGRLINQFPTPSDCASLLRLTPSLHTLILDIRSEGKAPNEDLGSLHLPLLHEIRISTCYRNRKVLQSTSRLIQNLVVPSLKVLQIQERVGSEIECLIKNSKCAIELLDVIGDDPDEEDAGVCGGWLRFMPGLKELKLKRVKISSNMLAALILSDSECGSNFNDAKFPELKGDSSCGIRLCPLLENMELIMCYFDGDEIRNAKLINALVLSRIMSRKGFTRVLKTLEVDDCIFLEPQEDDESDEGDSLQVLPNEILRIVKDGVDVESADMYVKFIFHSLCWIFRMILFSSQDSDEELVISFKLRHESVSA